MLKRIYPAELPSGHRCGFATEQQRDDFLAGHPAAIVCDPIEVTAQQLVMWKTAGNWDDDWQRGRFIAAGQLLRWGLDIQDPHTLTPSETAVIWADAMKGADRESYISSWALSPIWGDAPEGEPPQERIDYLGQLWDTAHMSVKDICKAAKLTQAGLAERFGIPRRTVEDWCRGVSKCADYIRLMMLECLGLLER